MAANPKNSEAKRVISKFAKTLLGATCLTAATGGAAMAGTITYTEGVNPASPAEWPATGPGTALAAAGIPGTTIVNGFTNDTTGFIGFFELTGLGTGTFTASANVTEGGDTAISVFADAGAGGALLEGGGGGTESGPGLFGPDFSNPLVFPSLAIPSDGNLVIEILDFNEDSASYSVTVNTTPSGVPEPSTMGMVGLGLAGALTLSRKRRQQ